MRSRWIGPGLALLLLGITAVMYDRLPERIPTHWNVHGEVDGWSPRFPGAFIAPLVILGVWLLALVLPRIDPKRAGYARFSESYWLVMNLLMTFLALLGVVTLAAALGAPVDVGQLVFALVGVLFIALGNYLPRIRSNWWLGVRTPWTLSSERVWQRTHRLAGWTFVLAGAAILGSAWLPPAARPWVMIPALVLAALVPTAYSYLAWSREQREDRLPQRKGEG